MTLSGVVIWVHVLCGSMWVASSASFLIAALALGSNSRETLDFARRVAPSVNLLGVGCAALLLLTGLGNLFFVTQARIALPPEFWFVLTGKLTLLGVMVAAQMSALARASIMRGDPAAAREAASVELAKLRCRYGVIVMAGGLALGLGLWLAGV